ncbi:MAG TPA: hypothetical protein VN368_03165 [Candidatus Methylomirabilis sp.]|jgi:protein-S-isoprenylcysteine O-methyltransferase Ste14|nr:hypothetical protein [Candidatus Methylomirabilis sp.]
MENILENVKESLTSPVTEKGQIFYTIAFVIAGVMMASTGVGLYSGAALILGAVLYNLSKIGLNRYWFEENSTKHWAIGISYMLLVGVGIITWMLISFGIL